MRRFRVTCERVFTTEAQSSQSSESFWIKNLLLRALSASAVNNSYLRALRTTMLKKFRGLRKFVAYEGGQSPFRKGDCPLSVAALLRCVLRGEYHSTVNPE